MQESSRSFRAPAVGAPLVTGAAAVAGEEKQSQRSSQLQVTVTRSVAGVGAGGVVGVVPVAGTVVAVGGAAGEQELQMEESKEGSRVVGDWQQLQESSNCRAATAAVVRDSSCCRNISISNSKHRILWPNILWFAIVFCRGRTNSSWMQLMPEQLQLQQKQLQLQLRQKQSCAQLEEQLQLEE